VSVYCIIEDCDRFAFINGKCYSHDKEEKREAKEKLKVKKAHKIPAKSKKKAKEDNQYSKEKPGFMEGKICPVYPDLPVKDIHHMKGRGEGFADAWAEANGITLTMDKRWWLAVSRKAHIRIGNNPKWAIKNGYSFKRLENGMV
jgi:hypothetical protein